MKTLLTSGCTNQRGAGQKTKQTYPPALKQGRRWVIDEDARFVGMVGSVDISSSLSDKARQLVEKAINGSSPQKT
ncbi:hypothetical protein M8309_09540 [Enterobacter hormaechei]|nr:hypothetical protein [Enterobacter hormaechei]MCM7009232.1 hypothetical protein [Enterobacter hormaechei]